MSSRPATLASDRALMRTLALPLRAADRLRWLWLRALGPWAKPLVRDRELRVALAGSGLLLVSFVLTLVLPLWLLALGPIVWGVPHVLSDVRYLWVRPGHHRRWALWLVAGVPLVVLSFTSETAWGMAAAAGALLVARGPWWRKALGLAVVAPLAWVSHLAPFVAAVVFAHAHNVIGVALWWSWRARRRRLHALPLVVLAGGCVALLSGVFDATILELGALGARPGGMDVYYHLGSLAPGVPGVLALRLVLVFAFMQAAHYVVWVRLVPDEDRPRETPRTFTASLRELSADLGAPTLALTLLAALGLALWAALDLFEARAGYLRAVLFHGHLEVVAAALLFVQGTRPGVSTGGPT